MSGYHEVKVFVFKHGSTESWGLPAGWKPFSAEFSEGILYVICRKWHRLPPTEALPTRPDPLLVSDPG